MAMPAGAPTRPDDEILIEKVRLSFRFQLHHPRVAALDVLINLFDGHALAEDHVGYDPSGISCCRNERKEKADTEYNEQRQSSSHNAPLIVCHFRCWRELPPASSRSTSRRWSVSGWSKCHL